MNIEDPTNITGLASLVNKRYVNDQVDIEKLEKMLMGVKSMNLVKEDDPVAEFSRTMREITGDVSSAGSKASSRISSRASSRASSKASVGGDVSDASISSRSSRQSSRSSHSNPAPNIPDIFKAPRYEDQIKKFGPAPVKHHRHHHKHHSSHAATADPVGNAGYLDNALRIYSGGHTDVDAVKESEEELKLTLLEDISELIRELEQSGIDSLRGIPEVNEDSSYTLVNKVHGILQRKYTRNRCLGFGKEIILSGAQGLEFLFDGKRRYGPFSPDLTGWHNVARSKINKMHYETSTIVSKFVNDYNISPFWRMMLELVPSMVLHNSMRKEITNQKNYNTEMSAALDDMRSFSVGDPPRSYPANMARAD